MQPAVSQAAGHTDLVLHEVLRLEFSRKRGPSILGSGNGWQFEEEIFKMSRFRIGHIDQHLAVALVVRFYSICCYDFQFSDVCNKKKLRPLKAESN
jgi:hypothetical protein